MQNLIDRSLRALALASCLCAATAAAQDVPKAQPVSGAPGVEEPKKKKDLAASVSTQTEARTMRLTIPAPRGQIVDRNGVSLAQNRVVNYLALNFPFIEKATPQQIVAFAREKINAANRVLGKKWELSDERILTHYQNRRWLPLVFSMEDGLNVEISPEQKSLLKPLLNNGLLLQPAYIRFYPKGDCAAHIVGYTGKTRPLPTGPIVDGDPLFEEMEGREGLEITFDAVLKGTPGEVELLFDPDGKLLSEEMHKHPVPGKTVVTCLDFNLQKYAENALKKGARNGGAMVIMDVRNGDILAMASNPTFDPNEFVFGIPAARWEQLTSDPKLPMLARAFRGEYPPASTFKIITALGALESGQVTPSTSYHCGTSLLVGDRYFHNHSKNDEGMMNVITAIKRSCNTWFYQAALDVGADAVTNMALRMGFRERTGIPLRAEGKGYMPTNADHKILGGELANISIGQGAVLATPLQVCQAMSALGDGVNMPQPRLVKQIQTIGEVVVEVYEPKIRRAINLQPAAREAVVKGMVAVVSGGGGTGRRAGLPNVQVAGKTGTAQWKVSKDQNLAWFTGFLPASQPTLAYAVLYEGSPGERVSGGGLAAPIVNEVFTNFFKGAPTDDPMVLAMKNAPKGSVDEGSMDSGGGSGDDDDSARVASTTVRRAAAVAPPPPPPPKRGIGGFFSRIFGGKK